jgi:KRAB domain-containing zinc finger protein
MTKAQLIEHRKLQHPEMMSRDEQKIVEEIAEVPACSRLVTCEFCGKTMKYASYGAHRDVLHFNMSHFECDTCGKKGYFKNKFIRHIRSHIKIEHREKLFKCEICGKTYASDCSLRAHKNLTHTPHPPESLTCHCGKAFKTKYFLRYHKTAVHMKHKYDVACEHCQKVMRNKYDLRKHIRIHHTEGGKNNFKCNDCEKCFNDRMYLQKHAQVHREKNLVCDVIGCGKKFGAQFALNIHKKNTHNKQKLEFICSQCGKALTSYQKLKRHVTLIHEKLRAPCPVGNGCKFSVGRRNYMRDHLKKHVELSSKVLEMHLNSVKDMKILS